MPEAADEQSKSRPLPRASRRDLLRHLHMHAMAAVASLDSVDAGQVKIQAVWSAEGASTKAPRRIKRLQADGSQRKHGDL